MNISLPPQFSKIQEFIDTKIKRERILIFLSVFAVIFMLWSFTLQRVFDQRSAAASERLTELQKQLVTTQTEIAAETNLLANDPNKQKKDKIAQINKEIQETDAKLQQLGNRLIRAEQLPVALQEVLLKTAKVKLRHLETLPAKELMLAGGGAGTLTMGSEGSSTNGSASAETVSAGVYQHRVTISLSGTYPEIVQLLESLEQLPWRFYWQSMSYEVVHYPEAEVILKVYTLSADEGLFGV